MNDVPEAEWIDNVRLIKIDVEGFEDQVLLGASQVLSAMRPVLILDTNDSLKLPFREHPAVATLIENDYSMFAIPKSFFSVHLCKIDVDRTGAPSHDVVALPKESYSFFKHLLE